MLTALTAALLLQTATASDWKLVEVWRKEVPAGYGFHTDERGNFYIGGNIHDPATGKEAVPKEYEIDVNLLKLKPQLIADSTGLNVFYHGEEYSLGASGIYYHQYPRFDISQLVKLDKQKHLIGTASPFTAPRVTFPRTPHEAFGNVRDNFLFIDHTWLAPNDRLWIFNSIVILEPFKASTLKFYDYIDVSNPRRALGWYHDDYEEWRRDAPNNEVDGEQAACGDIFTGKVHWKLPEGSLYGRVDDTILARKGGQWVTVDDKSGNLSTISLELLVPFEFNALDVKTAGGFLVIQDYDRKSSEKAIYCYRLEKERR